MNRLTPLAVALGSWLATAAVVVAAAPIPLIQFNSVWKFNQDDRDLGAGWRQPNYDDSKWDSGPGVIGWPPNEDLRGLATIGTRLRAGDDGWLSPFQLTHYFRIHFRWDYDAEGVVLHTTNLVDDGVVFYLNGVEAGSINMPPKADHQTMASNSREISSDGPIVLNLLSKGLVRGDNVLAVELHQAGGLIVDAVFGMKLWAQLPDGVPPKIVGQPKSKLWVTEGESVLVETVVAGAPPYAFTWYKEGMAIAGATNQNLEISRALTGHSGRYLLEARNAFGAATSSNLQLTVRGPALIPFHQVWKYRAVTAHLGADWKEMNYNDVGWAAGPGPLGFDSFLKKGDYGQPLQTKIPYSEVSTFYFRTEFDAPTASTVEMIMDAQFDDGGVIYLNGEEMVRLGMAPGAVDFLTVADRRVGAGFVETLPLPAQSLRKGQNVLAAEVHQANVANPETGADLNFGLRLEVKRLVSTWLDFAREPTNLILHEGQPAQLSVAVRGAHPSYQWFHDDQPIRGANESIYLVALPQASDAGTYRVQVTNDVANLTSKPVTVQFQPDTNAPTLLAADGRFSSNEIRLTFSEPLDLSTSTNPANYALTTAFGQPVTILSAVAITSTNVLVLTDARTPQVNHVLSAKNIRDASRRRTIIRSETACPVQARLRLIDFDSEWRFTHNLDRKGIEWTERGFDDRTWKSGHGAFWAGKYQLPVMRGTALDTNCVTTYFRRHITLQPDFAGSDLFLRSWVDDGAVFYLNGIKIYQFNMPFGAIDGQTLARAPVRTAELSDRIAVMPPALRVGDNLLAVELHRSTEAGAAFAAQFEAELHSLAEGPIVITTHPFAQTAAEGQTIELQADGAGVSQWQWYRDGARIDGATSRLLVITNIGLGLNKASFYAEAVSGTNRVPSRAAIVTVVADTEPPALIEAMARGNVVELTFSEPIDPAAAIVVTNYTITTSQGTVLPCTAAQMVAPVRLMLTMATSQLLGSVLVLRNVTDRSQARNAVPANSGVTIAFDGILIPLDHPWRFDQSGQELGEHWRSVDFDDGAWGSGPALLGEAQVTLPEPIRTPLLPTIKRGPVTTYFRTRFQLPTDPAATQLQLRYYVDDGAVFYLNGHEVHRVGVAVGSVATNLSERVILNPGHEGPVAIAAKHLVPGMNLLAVEVHQASEQNRDVVFGAELATRRLPSRAVQR